MKFTLYDDEHLRVIHQPGNGSTLIITFGDMLTLAKEQDFFAEAPSSKMKLPAIGFMAKSRNWYPESSIIAAIEAIQKTLNSMAFRVVYGGSMGGYAALKYARRLDADRIYALVPQYSIDPQVIADRRYNQYFDASLNTNNTITRQDLAGEVFITYDPCHPIDEQHARRIIALGYPVETVPLRFSDHGATTILASSEFFAAITRPGKILRHDMLKIMRSRRRASRHYIETLVIQLSRARSATALGLAAQQLRSGLLIPNKPLREAMSRSLVAGAANARPADGEYVMDVFGLNQVRRKTALSGLALKSTHAKYICYNAIAGELGQYTRDEIANCNCIHPLLVSAPHGLVTVQLHDSERLLTCRNGAFRLVTEDEAYNEKGYLVYRRSKGRYAVSNLAGNLSAFRNGTCAFGVEHLKDWELFDAEAISLP